MRQLFNQLIGKKPTMLTPSQMAMEELMSGVAEANRPYDDVPTHGAEVVPMNSTPWTRSGGWDEGNMPNPTATIGGDMGSMAMGALGGATGALNGIMPDVQKAPQMAPPAFTQGNPIRDNVLGRVTSGVPMRGLRYGGLEVVPLEGTDNPPPRDRSLLYDKTMEVQAAPRDRSLLYDKTMEGLTSGVAEVNRPYVPLEGTDNPPRDRSLLYDKTMEGQVARPGKPSPYTQQERGVIARSGQRVGEEYAPTPDASGREVISGEGGIVIDASEAIADDGLAPPPRRSLLDTKRIIARNNDGLTDEGVWQAREDVLREDQWKTLNEPVKKSKWKDIGMMLLTSLNNQVNNRQDPVRTWGEIKRDEKAAQLASQLQAVQQRRAEMDKRRTIDANIENTKEDNIRLREIAENNRIAKAEALTQKKREAFYRTNKYFDPAKATEAQKRQLAEIGETPESIGQYDFTKPDTKMVAGTLYQRNPSTGAYEDTGVKDPSKAVVEYTIIDPDTGVAQKYATTSERAAGLKTQLKAAGMQIQAANERQQSQQTYQAGENAKNRTADMQKFMVGYEERLRKEKQSNIFKAQEEMVKIKKALDDGVIDQDTFNQMMNTVQNLMK